MAINDLLTKKEFFKELSQIVSPFCKNLCIDYINVIKEKDLINIKKEDMLNRLFKSDSPDLINNF